MFTFTQNRSNVCFSGEESTNGKNKEFYPSAVPEKKVLYITQYDKHMGKFAVYLNFAEVGSQYSCLQGSGIES